MVMRVTKKKMNLPVNDRHLQVFVEELIPFQVESHVVVSCSFLHLGKN